MGTSMVTLATLFMSDNVRLAHGLGLLLGWTAVAYYALTFPAITTVAHLAAVGLGILATKLLVKLKKVFRAKS